MPLQEPNSMEELVYFTNRTLLPKGKARVWVFKQDCPKCKKAKMSKPANPNGGVKIRASEYVCPACKYAVEKGEYEEGLVANIDYVCPSCSKSGQTQVPFKRKMIDGVPTVRAKCESCQGNIDITKKMKAKKKKKGAAVSDDDDF